MGHGESEISRSTPGDPGRDNVYLRRPDLLIPGEVTLESICYFTPRTAPVTETKEKTKRIHIVRDDYEGEVTVRIVANAGYGLPITRDRDLFLGFMQLLWDHWVKQQSLPRFVTFSSNRILSLAKRDCGREWESKAVRNWRRRLQGTLITFDGDLKTLGDLRFTPDASYQVFGLGHGVEFDKVEAHVVELSTWFRERLAHWYVRPIDIEGELSLQSPIAKALSPLLDSMFFARWQHTHSNTLVVARDYDELHSDFLLVAKHTAHSLIRRQFKPACDELKEIGKIKDWNVRPSRTKKNGWILEFENGPRVQELWKRWKNVTLPSTNGRLPRLSAPPVEDADPERQIKEQGALLVQIFQQEKNKLENHTPTRKEWDQAVDYVRRHGFDDAARLVRISIELMKMTKFDAQFFGAVLGYEGRAARRLEAEKEKELRRRQAEESDAQAKAAAAATAQARRDLERRFDSLPEEERRRRLSEGRFEVEAQLPPKPLLKLDLDVLGRNRALERFAREQITNLATTFDPVANGKE